MTTAFLAILKRDLTLAIRQGGGIGTAIGFFLTVVVLLPLGLGPDQNLLSRIAPGALWIALLLSVLLSADKLWQADYDDGSLEVMALSDTPLEVTAMAKEAKCHVDGCDVRMDLPVDVSFLFSVLSDL